MNTLQKIVLCVSISFVMTGAFIGGALFFVVHHKCIDFSKLEHYTPGAATVLLDIHGVEWGRFQKDYREPVQLDTLPNHLAHAFIAVEDWDFFSHKGIAWHGIVRSLLVNLYHRKMVQGASTITQQLVKLLFLDSQKTLSRKIKEQLYALLVEQQFSKEQILQTYLNHVYFGCGIYGVQAASQRFWSQDATELSVAQAATIAGIVRSPANYCPLLYPLSAKQRRNTVLKKMFTRGFINENTYNSAIMSELDLVVHEKDLCAPHLKETIRLELEKRFGKEQVYTAGYIIQTTLDIQTQRAAEECFRNNIVRLRTTMKTPVDGALICLDTETKGVRALVGGADFRTSQWNRALQAHRQMGSVFKPLVYAAAIQKGASFADICIDEPFEMTIGGQLWQPKNYNGMFNGPVTLAYALSHSSNIVTIKTLLNYGAPSAINLAKQCGLQGPFHEYPSLALGTIDATLLDATSMFAVFANQGIYKAPHYITWIKDTWGNKLLRHTVEKQIALDTIACSKVAKVLSASLKRAGSALSPALRACEPISKTGTTNDSRTCWYIGATPKLVTGVYIGYDDNSPMGKHVFPVTTAFPIWKEFNEQVIPKELPPFVYDSTLKLARIDAKTGQCITDPKSKGGMAIFI